MRVWRDWVLLAAYLVGVVVEAAARPDVIWRPAVTVVALAIAPVLLWRRTHPLGCVLAGFGAGAVLLVAQLVTGVHGDVGLNAMATILLLLYTLVRWGSGREIVLGLTWVVVVATFGMAMTSTTAGDVVGACVVMFAAVSDGAAFRYRADMWGRRLDAMRGEERVRLARELHDTVAHHVSAIAVQAQAGQAVAAARPGAAAEVLGAIEREASRTLAEMRGMVRLLREGVDPEYAPQPGVADLAALARDDATPRVSVTVDRDVHGLPPALDTALYRLAQESLTNALRHARSATRVDIEVGRHGDHVRLMVVDDGEASPTKAEPVPGYGLVGMRERVQLLGGTFGAGARDGRGWVVTAELPVGAGS